MVYLRVAGACADDGGPGEERVHAVQTGDVQLAIRVSLVRLEGVLHLWDRLPRHGCLVDDGATCEDDGWMDGWMDGCMNGWMLNIPNGWMDTEYYGRKIDGC